MAASTAFATKIPSDLKEALDETCEKLGLRKNFVIEAALREKIENILDAYDLEGAITESTGFVPWDKAKGELKKRGRL